VIKLDPVDKKLIKLLQHDALQSSTLLAKQLEVSPATVRRRIKRLVEDRVIHVIAAVDPSRWRLNISAFVALKVDTLELDNVLRDLGSLEQVVNMRITTGGFDIITLVQVASIGELDDLLRCRITPIPGVLSLETFLCLKHTKIREVIELFRGAKFSAVTSMGQKEPNLMPDNAILSAPISRRVGK